MDNLIAVSSWSIHRTIGISYPDSPTTGPQDRKEHSPSPIELLDVPTKLSAHGYSAMQLCHFHLPSRENAYAAELRASLRESNVELLTLLIDEGDITHPESGEASLDWIAGWVRTASLLGASRARIIAGKQPYSAEAMAVAVERLTQLATIADEVGVQLETENRFALLATPTAVNELLDRLEGKVRLCADFGNWPKPEIYGSLPKIMGRAETCHAKFEFLSPNELDTQHGDSCLGIAAEASYTGPFVLVNGGIGESDWDAMDLQRHAIRQYSPS